MKLAGRRRQQTASAEAALVLAGMAYEHAVRGLDSQAGVIQETRTRANYAVAASAALATLGAGSVLEKAPSHWIALGAAAPLLFLLGGVYFAMTVLRPTGKQGQEGKLQLVASANAILALHVVNATAARGAAATALEAMWDGNQSEIDKLMTGLRRSFGCLAAQLACWAILLVLKQVT